MQSHPLIFCITFCISIGLIFFPLNPQYTFRSVPHTILKKLDPIESLLERIALLEKNIYTTKQVFTFQEACMYIGISESMLYKLTSGKEIPHYKPRGKMIYFAKEDLDEWLLQNYEPTVDEAARMANEAAATQPFFNQRRHGKRKKN